MINWLGQKKLTKNGNNVQLLDQLHVRLFMMSLNREVMS